MLLHIITWFPIRPWQFISASSPPAFLPMESRQRLVEGLRTLNRSVPYDQLTNLSEDNITGGGGRTFIYQNGVAKAYFKAKVHTSLNAHTAWTHPAFNSMKHQGALLLSPGWDASPTQGYSQHHIAGTHLYTWVERDSVELCSLSKETRHCHHQGSNSRPPTCQSDKLTTTLLCLHSKAINQNHANSTLPRLSLRKYMHSYQ